MKLKTLKTIALAIGISSLVVNSPAYAATQVTLNNGKVKISGVPVINQFPELPTGCEATALTMLLRAFEVKVTKQEVANKIPKVSLPYYKNGTRYGGDPNIGFVGNPNSSASYGVFEKPILQVINHYLPGRGENLTGKQFDELLAIVKSGRPVMVWATINMENVVYRQSWKFSTGQAFSWPGKEHAMVITGYDRTYVYVNDPYTGNERKYQREVIANRYHTLGKRAVTIVLKDALTSEEANKQKVPTVNEQPREAVKVVIDEKDLEEGKGAILRSGRVFIPVKYIGELIETFEYQYIDKELNIYINNYQYGLAANQEVVNLRLEDGSTQPLHYFLEEGVTLVEFKGLADYLGLSYVFEEGTLLVKTGKDLNTTEEEILVN